MLPCLLRKDSPGKSFFRTLSFYEVDFNKVLIVTACKLADCCGFTHLAGSTQKGGFCPISLIPSLQTVENLSIQHITSVFPMQIYNFSPGILIHFCNFSPRIRSSVATFRPDVMQRYYRLNSQTNLCNVCNDLDLSIVLLHRVFYAVALQDFLVFHYLETICPVRKSRAMETICRMSLDGFLGGGKSFFARVV